MTHPPTIVTPLYHVLEKANLLPGFLQDPHKGKLLFEIIVFSWLVALFLILLALLVYRRMKKTPGRLQSGIEIMVEGLANLLDSLIGPGGRKYLPLLGTLFIFIFCLNLMGIIPGMMSPTSSWNCTIALAMVVIIYVQGTGIKEHGFFGYLKHLAGSPKGIAMWCLAPLMLPLHILGELVKPLSLSLRLFCNIYGEDTVILSIINLGFPYIWLTIIMVAFAVLTSLIQAFIFTALSCIYIMILTSHTEEH